MKTLLKITMVSLVTITFIACFSCSTDANTATDSSSNIDTGGGPPDGMPPGGGGPGGGGEGGGTYTPTDDDEAATELHAAFAEFNSEATDIYLSNDGKTVTIETTGLPNHETVYWGVGDDLYREESGVQTTPSTIYSNDNAITIVVDAVPNLVNTSVETQLGTIGIAVSGSSIFNDQEGGGALDEAAVSLDWTGGHIGPGVYHYHLEPKAFTNDDDKLVGVLLDGVFLYGRKDYPSGEYPTDLDESGGHFGPTPHNLDGEYHYHIINEIYSTTGSYIAFAGPYQGY